jgi:CO/xanthine dehydrogenase Mo-binding subunit
VALGVRVDAPGKVSGTTRYANDLVRPGMLWGKVLRSPLPHARIVSIDTSDAARLPGVHAVLTGQDIPPEVRVGRNMRDMPVLARDKVRFVGEKVVAVAAESEDIAEQALKLVQVEYDSLPAVFEPREAIQPGATLIHDPATVRAWAVREQVVPDYPNGASAPTWGATEDEVRTALGKADRVFEHTFRTPIQHQLYLEPHICLVEVDAAGVAHIWAANKAPILLATYLREGLGLQRDQLDINILPLGGDFGGKGSFMDIPLAYFLSTASGRPVKMAMNYVDELTAGNPRHGSTIVVQSGVMNDGRLVARWLRGYLNSGAYAAFKPSTDTTLPGFRRGATGPYAVAVHREECHMIYTNTVPAGHMRSPGEAQTAYALECHTDLIARAMHIDPVAFRILNGTTHPRLAEDGGRGSPPRVREVLELASQAIGLDRERPQDVGRGVALIEFATSPGVYSAIMTAHPAGTVTLQTPIVENGAGAITTFRQIVAEEFVVPVEQVSVVQSIEDIEVDRGVGGSRVTRLVGKLSINLARRLQHRLAEIVAAEYGLAADDVTFADGLFRAADGRTWSLADATTLAGEDLVEHMTLNANAADESVTFLAQAVEVHVDRETGQVTPRKIVSVHEVGRVVNPMLFRTQIYGAAMQGLGYALMEGLRVEDGRVTNVNLHEYKIPTMADAPEFEIVLLPADLSLGLTPIGEGPNAGAAPALVNAVVDAIGPHPLDIPLSPDVVRRLAAQGGAADE